VVEDGRVLPVTGEKVSARLGAGVDATGRIEEARITLAAEAIGLFARVAALNGAPEPAVLATSAVRDAENGLELVEEVRERFGLSVRLISGEEEALLGFQGAVSALEEGALGPDAPVLVVDLGGGSMQLIFGSMAGGPEKRVSLQLGSNRTTERFVSNDPPEAGQLKDLRKAAQRMLPDWELPGETEVVAVGGSARAMLRLARGRKLTRERLRALAKEASGMPAAELARREGLAPERARVLPAAISTLEAVLRGYDKRRLLVARGGVREGAILAWERNGGG
jgi:exopolyphosphatase/guanosine-5'-triphosphate,3'-diphosphate pyrophosphatase